jgi:hypothetical protein
MAAARPSALNTKFLVFILVLRRRRPMISFPAGEVAGATRVVAVLPGSGNGRRRAAEAEMDKIP